MPTQEANKNYFTHMANNNVRPAYIPSIAFSNLLAPPPPPNQLDQLTLPYQQTVGNALLEKVARLKPYYERNKARVCSFWVKGTCTRGDLCPYTHENRRTNDDEDPLSKQNLKDRFLGRNDPLAEKILNRISNNKDSDMKGPADQTITSLFISNLSPEITQQDIQ